MSNPTGTTRSAQHFDAFATEYETLLDRSVSLSGEGAEYFARYKLARIRQLCGASAPASILDIGCGVGLLTERLGQAFPGSRVMGLDLSPQSVEQAASRCAKWPNVTFRAYAGTRLPVGIEGVELVILANVLHHVDPEHRQAFLAEVVRPALQPGARVVVFEHNPYNPLTRFVVRSCAFDRDAQLLTRGQTTRLLRRSGLEIVRRDYLVFFPHPLRWLRRFEPRLGSLPLGAQYLVVGHWDGAP